MNSIQRASGAACIVVSIAVLVGCGEGDSAIIGNDNYLSYSYTGHVGSSPVKRNIVVQLTPYISFKEQELYLEVLNTGADTFYLNAADVFAISKSGNMVGALKGNRLIVEAGERQWISWMLPSSASFSDLAALDVRKRTEDGLKTVFDIPVPVDSYQALTMVKQAYHAGSGSGFFYVKSLLDAEEYMNAIQHFCDWGNNADASNREGFEKLIVFFQDELMYAAQKSHMAVELYCSLVGSKDLWQVGNTGLLIANARDFIVSESMRADSSLTSGDLDRLRPFLRYESMRKVYMNTYFNNNTVEIHPSEIMGIIRENSRGIDKTLVHAVLRTEETHPEMNESEILRKSRELMLLAQSRWPSDEYCQRRFESGVKQPV